MMARCAPRLALVLLPLTAAGNVCAQTNYTQQRVPGTPPLLQRVDPVYADVSPLGESLREVDMQADLRTPTGFQNVYRMPGRDDLLMRASGGIYAIFPQSAYMPTAQGMAAIVPPGTVFSIGMPGPWMLTSRWVVAPNMLPLNSMPSPAANAAAAESRRAMVAESLPVDDRRGMRAGGRAWIAAWTADGAPSLAAGLSPEMLVSDPRPRQTLPPEPATFLKSVVTDDAYRARRLAELLQAAAEASRRSVR